jgi:acyl carrier protein
MTYQTKFMREDNMLQSELIEKITTALSKALGGKVLHDVTLKTKLREDLGLDSITSLTFLMALEDEVTGFTVNPDTLNMDDLDCVETIENYVRRQLGKE